MHRAHPSPENLLLADKKTYYDRYAVFYLHDLNKLSEPTDSVDVPVAPGINPSPAPSASARLEPLAPPQSSPDLISTVATPAISGAVSSPTVNVPPPPPSLAFTANWQRYNESVQGSLGGPSTTGAPGGAGENSFNPVSFQDLFKKVYFSLTTSGGSLIWLQISQGSTPTCPEPRQYNQFTARLVHSRRTRPLCRAFAIPREVDKACIQGWGARRRDERYLGAP